MKSYVEQYEKTRITGTTESVIKTVAYRYMQAHPPVPFAYRACSKNGFHIREDGCHVIDFDEKFPDAPEGSYGYAISCIRSGRSGETYLSYHAIAPAELYVNGELVTKTTALDEGTNEKRFVSFQVQPGYNTVFIKCRKNALGFGCCVGTTSIKWSPCNFYTAFAENAGDLGWNYCGPFSEDIFPEIPSGKEPMAGYWLPRPYDPQLPAGNKELYAVSMLSCKETAEVAISCESDAVMELYCNGQPLSTGKGSLSAKTQLEAGCTNIAVHLRSDKEIGHFSCTAEGAEFCLPEDIKATKSCWLYLESADDKAKQGFQRFALYDTGIPGQKTTFLCGKDTYIRPVLENNFFGKATYPLGVVLYGLLTAGAYLHDEEILQYAHSHLKSCYASMDYALWERSVFGFAAINHQLLVCDALDDCGAFAASVLEDYLRYHRDAAVLPFADYVGDHILHKQERLENGMFYRATAVPDFKYTVWADDLYMSIPFMVRYAQITGDASVMDDAVNQFLRFKEALFMPEAKLASHVYNLTYQKPTRIPWGRGNGWMLFSLTELLAVLSKEHRQYSEIVQFFTELAEGFLNHIDADGMLHQIIWDPDSYQEASCTAMCASAFARGVRMGLLPRVPYQDAAEKCVDALKKICIDSDGNIYGVCSGSRYSFRPEYYKYELSASVNDTHGTGVFLIAMVEVERNKGE